jgi:hypothetical protein
MKDYFLVDYLISKNPANIKINIMFEKMYFRKKLVIKNRILYRIHQQKSSLLNE